MNERDREPLFSALLGPVDRVDDPGVIAQLEEIACGQLAEIEPTVDELLGRAAFDLRRGAALGILRALGFGDIADEFDNLRVRSASQTCAIPGGASGARESAQALDDPSRCAVCGWRLAENAASGCVRGYCSLRPIPPRLYAPERAALEYRRAWKDEGE